jgi:hypothetical protein
MGKDVVAVEQKLEKVAPKARHKAPPTNITPTL